MANDVKLDNDLPVDEHLRTIKVGGEVTALEVSKNGVRTKDLEISGNTKGIVTEYIKSTSDLTLRADDNIYLHAGDNYIRIMQGEIATCEIDSSGSGGAGCSIKLSSILDSGDYFKIDTTTHGATTISTEDDDATSGDLTLDIDGDITVDSSTGVFIAKNNGTEFSVANSAYAGMILGFTEVFDDSISSEDTFQATTTSFVNLSLTQGGGEKYLKVVFVVPPSNKVLIKTHLPFCSGCDGSLLLGLATDTSATTLHEDYERAVWDVDESDIVGIHYQWVIHGSDHSWSAGESKTLYVMVKENTAGGRIYSGDSAFQNYGAWTMEAVALPATIGDGS